MSAPASFLAALSSSADDDDVPAPPAQGHGKAGKDKGKAGQDAIDKIDHTVIDAIVHFERGRSLVQEADRLIACYQTAWNRDDLVLEMKAGLVELERWDKEMIRLQWEKAGKDKGKAGKDEIDRAMIGAVTRSRSRSR